MIEAFLVLLLFAETVALYLVVKNALKMRDKMDDLNEQIDESIAMLDNYYVSIGRAAGTPVLSDEPIIKKLMSDIKGAKHAVVLVMNKMGEFDQEEAIDEDEEDEG